MKSESYNLPNISMVFIHTVKASLIDLVCYILCILYQIRNKEGDCETG